MYFNGNKTRPNIGIGKWKKVTHLNTRHGYYCFIFYRGGVTYYASVLTENGNYSLFPISLHTYIKVLIHIKIALKPIFMAYICLYSLRI